MNPLEDFLEKLKEEGSDIFYVRHSQETAGIKGYLSFIVWLRDIIKMKGGRLKIEEVNTVVSKNQPKYGSSEDISNEEKELVPADEPYNYKREDLYEAIKEHVTMEKQREVKDKFDKRFPESIWEDKIPENAVAQIFLKEHLEDLV